MMVDELFVLLQERGHMPDTHHPRRHNIDRVRALLRKWIFTSSKPVRPLGKHDNREVCCKLVKEYCDADNDTDYTSSIQQTQYLYICDRYSGRVSEKVLVQAQARYQGEEMFAISHFGMGSPIVDTV